MVDRIIIYYFIIPASIFLNIRESTDGKEADLAVFLTPVGGILAKGSIIAFELDSFWGLSMEDPLLWRVISNGPAWDSLFSNTLK